MMPPLPNPSGTQNAVPPEHVGRSAQIITVALALGVCFFGGIAITISHNRPPEAQPVLSWIAAGFAGLMVVISFALPQIATAGQLRGQSDAIRVDHRQSLAPLYLQRNILRRAPLEGAAFFNLVAYILDSQLWTLGVVAVLLVLLLVPFPTQTDFENWADQVRRDLA